MSVEELERRFYELKGKLDVGAITEEAFKAEIDKLRFQDAENRWWMIGAQSGKWYVYDGTRWLPGKPPRQLTTEPPLSIQPAPSAEPAPAQRAPADSVAPQPTRTEPVAAIKPMPTPPPPAVTRPMPSRMRRARPPIKLPISGPLLVGLAALAAIVLVLLFWIAIDNLLPGKPISGFFAKPAATATPRLAAVASTDIAALVSKGDELLLQSQIDAAIAQYASAAQSAPSNPTPLTRWSRALAFRGQMADALAKAHQATQRAPNDAEAQAQLARVLAWSGDVNQAIAVGEKAVQLDAKNWNAQAFLAEAYLLARRNADAQTYAQAALQMAPQSAEAHRAQAWVLTMLGQREAALAEWQQTVTIEPNLFFRHFEFGEVLRLYFNSPAEAVAEYQRAAQLNGAYIPVYGRLGLALLDAGHAQDAIAQFKRAVTLDPKNAEAIGYLGLAFQKANQCEQAIPYFLQALQLNANNASAARGLNECQTGKTPAPPVFTVPTEPLRPPTVMPSITSPGVPGTKAYP